jgi:hypothetical protein
MLVGSGNGCRDAGQGDEKQGQPGLFSCLVRFTGDAMGSALRGMIPENRSEWRPSGSVDWSVHDLQRCNAVPTQFTF